MRIVDILYISEHFSYPLLVLLSVILSLYKFTYLSSKMFYYGLDNQAVGVQFPAEAKDFFSLASCVHTSSGAHPASYPMGTGGPFPGIKCSRGATLTTHPI
jgi:hypothetical protein